MVWMILSSLIVYLVLQPYQVSWDAFQINRYVRLVRLHRAATYFFRSNKNSWHCVCLKAIEWRLRRFFKHSPDQELTWVTSESEWQDDCQCDIIQLTKSKMKIFSMKRSTSTHSAGRPGTHHSQLRTQFVPWRADVYLTTELQGTRSRV